MDFDCTRRSVLSGLVASAAVTALPAMGAPRSRAEIKYGYTAMTWNDAERQAINDISAAGYAGIQLRNNAVDEFKPAELKSLLAQHSLAFVALSSGQITLEKPAGPQIAEHVAHAQFVKDSGGLYLQILDQLKAYPRMVTPEECKQLGGMLTDLGKRTAAIGVPLVYHNHVDTISEHPQNLATVMESSDPEYVHLLLDTAHALAGGGYPAKMIEQYRDRLLLLHLKDVVDVPMTGKMKYPFDWVELGRGRVDFPAVFAALGQIEYHGWAVVELDHVPDPPNTPKQCAVISRNYLEKLLNVRI
jgi:inosose dehydratase